MPSKKQKGGENPDLYELTRKPVGMYPNLGAENLRDDSRKLKQKNKPEKMDFSSSDESPEKQYPYKFSPIKMTSQSSIDFEQSSANGARRRNGKRQQKQPAIFEDSNAQNISPESKYSENSDVEVKEDDSENTDYLPQRQETLESPELDKHDYSPVTFRKLKPRKLKVELQGETMHPPNKNSFLSFGGICLILVCIILIGGFFKYSNYPTSSNESNQPNATILVNSLKDKFKNQPPITFRIIFNALKNVLHTEPNAPAIILLLATNCSEAICSDFALNLINSLSVPKNTVEILGKDYKEANAAQAKLDVDRAIDKALEINKLGSVLIYNLDLIPGQTAIILHKYYDHENAPFKKAVFVMTVNYNKPISDYSNTREWDKAAYDHLLGVWTDSGVDQVTALLSRLTVSVAVIKNETL